MSSLIATLSNACSHAREESEVGEVVLVQIYDDAHIRQQQSCVA